MGIKGNWDLSRDGSVDQNSQYPWTTKRPAKKKRLVRWTSIKSVFVFQCAWFYCCSFLLFFNTLFLSQSREQRVLRVVFALWWLFLEGGWAEKEDRQANKSHDQWEWVFAFCAGQRCEPSCSFSSVVCRCATPLHTGPAPFSCYFRQHFLSSYWFFRFLPSADVSWDLWNPPRYDIHTGS